MKFTDGKKIIGVIGSTGLQGGGLVRAILNDKKESPFVVRAFTRNPNKDAAKALREAGAEVVLFDMDNDNIEEIAAALEGIYGLFVVTNFWEHFDQERESKQAQAVIAAGELAGVKHYIWSTLDDTVPFFESLPEEMRPKKINGTYVPFFDMKTQTNKFFPKEKTTFVYTSAYLEDLFNYGWVQDGVFTANLDDTTKLPVMAVEDIGKCSYGVFKAGTKYLGKKVHLSTDRVTGHELMKIASEALGKEFTFQRVDHKTYAAGNALIGNMFEYMRLNAKYSESLDPEEAKELISPLTIREFFMENKDKMLAIGPK